MNSSNTAADIESRWGPKELWTLPAQLHGRAADSPTQGFLQIRGGPGESYKETYERSLEMAARLRFLGITHGDAVVLMGPNSAEMIHLWFAANLLGAHEVPLNTAYRGRSLSHAINLPRSSVMVLAEACLDQVREISGDLHHIEKIVLLDGASSTDLEVAQGRIHTLRLEDVPLDREPDDGSPEQDVTYRDLASIIYTSGTTGPAKGVMVPHGHMHTFGRAAVDMLRMREDDVFYLFHAGAMFHSAKFIGINGAMVNKSSVVVDTEFDPGTWISRVREHGATVSLAHGPMMEMILSQPEGPEDRQNPLRALLCAGVPPTLRRKFEERFDVRLVEGFAMTEVAAIAVQSLDEPTPSGSCGKPMDHINEVELVDPDTDEPVGVGEIGEIVVRPRARWTMMQGYMGMPDKTVESWRNLWFHTGDLARFDENGYLYFMDRAGDRIRRRAENIASYEIEEAASEHPSVWEVAAVGVPSGVDIDDEIKLCVVPRRDAEFPYVDLIEYLVPRLPHYMIPRYIEVVDELPRSVTNKIQKRMLRDRGAAGEEVWDRRAAGVSVREIHEGRARPWPSADA